MKAATPKHFSYSMYVLSAFVSLCILNSSNGGILRTGNPLHWNVAKPVLQSVRLSGIKQFIYHYNRSKDIETPLFLWGDEIEYGLFGYNSKSKRFDLSPRGREIREQLSILEKDLTHLRSGCEWQVWKCSKSFWAAAITHFTVLLTPVYQSSKTVLICECYLLF